MPSFSVPPFFGVSCANADEAGRPKPRPSAAAPAINWRRSTINPDALCGFTWLSVMAVSLPQRYGGTKRRPFRTPDLKHYQRPPDKRNGPADRISAGRRTFPRKALRTRIATPPPRAQAKLCDRRAEPAFKSSIRHHARGSPIGFPKTDIKLRLNDIA